MTIENMIKRIQDITRQDAGINGDAQRIEQLVWMLFLKIYDAKEEFWEFEEDAGQLSAQYFEESAAGEKELNAAASLTRSLDDLVKNSQQ